jgi:LEA14-like dessication related protein
MNRAVRFAVGYSVAMVRCALLGLLVCGCATLGGLVEKPKVTLRTVEVTRASFDGVSANFVFNVENPNPISVDLARLDYQVTLDGHALTGGRGDKPLSVPRNGTGTMVLPVSVRYVELGSAIGSMMTKQTLPYEIKATLGFATPIGTVDIPVESSGTFPVPQLPRPQLVGAQLLDLSLGGVTLRVNLALVNPNTFAVPVGGLAWRLGVEGTEVASGKSPAVDLPGNAALPVQLDVRIDFLRAGGAVASALRSGSATVAVEGQLDLGPFKIPVAVRQSLPLR